MKSMIAMIAALAMITSVATAQFPEGFETATTGTATCGTTNPGTFPLGWTSGGNNPFLVDNNGTSSTNTGPTAANTGTNYVHIETSCAAGIWVGELEMPMIDANGLTNPTLDFAYHMFGAAMGSLEVQVFVPNACPTEWVTVWYLAGDQGNQWNNGQANISAGVDGSGMVRARFVGTRGTSFTSDIALDDVDVSDPAAAVPVTTGPPATGPDWQVNSPEAYSDINGVTATATVGAEAAFFVTDTATFNASSSTALPFDALVAAGPSVANGTFPAFATPNLQVVNLDWTSPIQFFLNSGTPAPNFVPLASPLALNFNVPAAGVATTQSIFLDPSACDAFRLSQATQLTVTVCGSTPLPALSDDDNETYSFCFPFNFYGTTYQEVNVGSNGHLDFGGASTGWASGGTGLQNFVAPTIAAWSEDFNPAAGGMVTATTNTTDTFTVTYAGVPSFGTTNMNDFSITVMNIVGGSTVTVAYGATNGEVDGTIGLSPGNGTAGTVLVPTDLSSLAGTPLAINPLDIVFEDFTGNFDLNGLTLTWTLDTAGMPVAVQ